MITTNPDTTNPDPKNTKPEPDPNQNEIAGLRTEATQKYSSLDPQLLTPTTSPAIARTKSGITYLCCLGGSSNDDSMQLYLLH